MENTTINLLSTCISIIVNNHSVFTGWENHCDPTRMIRFHRNQVNYHPEKDQNDMGHNASKTVYGVCEQHRC